jgi:hypothetical protein
VAKQTNWVEVARLTDRDAYPLKFKLYHAHIPHDFEQTNARTIPPVPEEFRGEAARLISEQSNRATGGSPRD